jgi:YbbR domain-containing protein
MKRKINFATLVDNNTLRVGLSLLSAALIWFMVVRYVDTETTATIPNVPVAVDTASSALTRLDLKPVAAPQFAVDVEIAGPRVVVGNIKASDIQISAKLYNISGPGTYTLALDSIDLHGKGFEIRQTTPDTISLRFDHMITKELEVELELSGLSIPEGYILDQEYVYPPQVTVTGPATEMALVESCQAQLSFEKPLAQSGTYDTRLLLLDAGGTPIESAYLTLDQQTASVTLPILRKKDVPVTFDFVNLPPGFDLDTLVYSVTPAQIEIAGPSASVSGVTELHLGYIDLRTLSPDLSLYYGTSLPPGFISVENIQEIAVEFDPEGFEKKELNVTDLRLINQPVEYAVSISTRTIYGVSVYGPAEEVARLTAKDLVAQIDMTDADIRVGQVTVPVSILIPSSQSCWAFGDDYTAVITVRNK